MSSDKEDKNLIGDKQKHYSVNINTPLVKKDDDKKKKGKTSKDGDIDKMLGSLHRKSVNVKTARRRKSSSTQWLQRQLNDPYVELAQKLGYRSRAAFKLIEIEEKYQIFKKARNILDLGAAPGAWSQVCVKNIEGEKKIIAVDLLDIDPIPEVDFICGDFLNPTIQEQILELVGGEQEFDLVLSDMAANTTGDKDVDNLRIVALLEEVLGFVATNKLLTPRGIFICKIFMGFSDSDLMTHLKTIFKFVEFHKPKSSRKNSKEMYIIARELR